MEDAVISVYQIPRAGLAGVPVGTAWLTATPVWKLSSALRCHNAVRMVKGAFPRSKFAMVTLTVWMALMKWTVSTSYPAPGVPQYAWLLEVPTSILLLKYPICHCHVSTGFWLLDNVKSLFFEHINCYVSFWKCLWF